MIQEFQVQNFYSIRERQTISFVPTNDDRMRDQYVHEVGDGVELLKIGIVYGSNASGKTTLLNALSFFRSIMLDKPESKNEGMGYFPFLLDNHSRNEHSQMQMTFWINREKYIMSLEFDNKRIYEESLIVYTSVRPTSLYKRVYQSESDHTEVTFGAKAGLDKAAQRAIEGNTTNNCSVMAAFGQSNAPTSKLNDVYEFFYSGLQSILSPKDSLSFDVKNELRNDKDGKKKRFLLQLLKASDFNIVDMVLNENEESITPEMEKAINSAPIPEEAKIEMLKRGTIKHDEIIFKHNGEEGEYELHEGLESAGTNRFMGMSIVLYYVLHENNFIPVDEIETSIHYELLSYFIKLFLANSEGSSQILMTTHDINLLNEDFIRRDIIWFTDKSEVGATQIKRLSSLGLHKTMNPYNAYKQGKLVDLPFLGSIYLETE
ncbi:ATP/GTP-binding protein [Prevotella sp. P6B1]|uniref:AAA family ATPase n=1 Tax=Prevotella sp. P6B1 TaxID=1410613 RepID=UPI00051C18B7|nr:ATP-binding protein [Prevotella sp. P6B1]